MSLIFLGDSLTAFHDWSRFGDHHNAGIPGDTTDGLLYRLQYTLDKSPDTLVLMIGINDILQNVPLQQISRNYSSIVNALSSIPDIHLLSCLPVTHLQESDIINRIVTDLNDSVRVLAKSSRCNYIDLYEHFVDHTGCLQSGLSTDGVHLNTKGYQVWENIISPFLDGNGTLRH